MNAPSRAVVTVFGATIFLGAFLLFQVQLPLVLYLLSFIVCFDRERWYARGPWALLLVLAITLSAFVLERGVYVRGVLQIGVPAFALFVACMVCHGELVRPAAGHDPVLRDQSRSHPRRRAGGRVVHVPS